MIGVGFRNLPTRRILGAAFLVGPMERLLALLPSALMLLASQLSAPSAAIAHWPALDFKSDRAFYPLMVSFSRYPFHDVYETAVGSVPVPVRPPPTPAAPSPRIPAGRGASQLAKARRPFPGGNARDWRHQSHSIRMPTKIMCEGLMYLPQELEASGRRMLPPKMRKLLKYCGFI